METVIDAADIKAYADEYCQMHKDAARYRWLKRRSWEGTGAIFFASVDCITGESVDAAIDREIENAKTRK